MKLKLSFNKFTLLTQHTKSIHKWEKSQKLHLLNCNIAKASNKSFMCACLSIIKRSFQNGKALSVAAEDVCTRETLAATAD